MARRNKSIFELILVAPWQVGFGFGILFFVVIRYGIGWFLQSSGSSLLQPVGTLMSAGSLAPLAWGALGVCWLGALCAFIGHRLRGNLLEKQTSIETLRAMSWRQFETLVGEAFRRRGYRVEETGHGGADGGIDLKLRLDDRLELVQCKQWRTQQVKVSTVREMWGLVAHEHASGVKIVCIGTFSPDAKAFAQGKAIELISGDRLLELVRDVQTAPKVRSAMTAPRATQPTPIEPKSTTDVIACPQCGSTMIKRFNRETRDPFLGCSVYPKCRGTRKILG